MDYNETIANLEDDIRSLLERNKELEKEIEELKKGTGQIELISEPGPSCTELLARIEEYKAEVKYYREFFTYFIAMKGKNE